jgi:hypothetical protein
VLNRKSLERVQADEQKELKHLPRSHEHYRRQALLFVGVSLDGCISQCSNNEYAGYRYAPEVIEALEAKCDEIEQLLETGRTLFAPEVRRARVETLKARSAAAADPGLHAFLHKLKS